MIARIKHQCFSPVLLNDSNFKSSNRIGGEMVSVLASSGVDRGFEPRLGQTQDYGICCFSAEHVALRRRTKTGWTRNQDNVSMDYKNQTKRVGLVQSGPHHHFIENVTCSRHDIAEKLRSWR